MTMEEIRETHNETQELSGRSLDGLRAYLRGDDPYEAITFVGHAKARHLAQEVAGCLRSEDSMVRWNAVTVLTSRLHGIDYAEAICALARNDDDEVVRAAAVAGLGEILPLLAKPMSTTVAGMLLRVFHDEAELIEMRGAAYEGMLAALRIPPQHRPSAARLIDVAKDVEPQLVERFEQEMLGPESTEAG